SLVTTLCAEVAGDRVLCPANLNGGGQVVVAGHAEAVERLIARVRTQGGRAQPLKVTAPFHCPLMAPAASGLERVLANVPVAELRTVVLSSVDAQSLQRASVKATLVTQVTAPVRWAATVQAMAAHAPTTILEVGPGRVLSGLIKRIVPELAVLPVG